MKSMKGKKKNLTKDLGLDNNKPYNGPNGPIIYKPDYILPQGYHGACHLHKEILLFKTMNDLIKHDHEQHDYRKMSIL